MSWYVNYQPSCQISVADRGLAYGDGLFETLAYQHGHLNNLNAHLKRLFLGLERLAMAFSDQQKQQLQTFLDELILTLSDKPKVIKIMVTRGEGGRGYLPPSNCHHNIIIGVLESPDYRDIQENGVSLTVSNVPISENPYTAGLKHLNKLENILAKQALVEPYFEAVMLTQEGNVIECIQSNIFWFKDGVLFTPSLEFSGVKGTVRESVINQQTLFSVHQGCFKLTDLKAADEIFITNSLMRIVPVKQFQEKAYSNPVQTQQLISLLY
ncbi:aminodeoxychorismate lyase [Marinomonas epiphytica]